MFTLVDVFLFFLEKFGVYEYEHRRFVLRPFLNIISTKYPPHINVLTYFLDKDNMVHTFLNNL